MNTNVNEREHWGNTRHQTHRSNRTPQIPRVEGVLLSIGAPQLLPFVGRWVDCQTKSGIKKVKVRNWTMIVEGERYISAQSWNPATLGIVPISALILPKPECKALMIVPPMAIVVYTGAQT